MISGDEDDGLTPAAGRLIDDPPLQLHNFHASDPSGGETKAPRTMDSRVADVSAFGGRE